jgi:hypothetical protein
MGRSGGATTEGLPGARVEGKTRPARDDHWYLCEARAGSSQPRRYVLRSQPPMKVTVPRFLLAALFLLNATCASEPAPAAPGEKCAPNPDHWETTCFDAANLLFCMPGADGVYRWSDFSKCKMGTCSCDGGGDNQQPWYPNSRGRCNCWY